VRDDGAEDVADEADGTDGDGKDSVGADCRQDVLEERTGVEAAGGREPCSERPLSADAAADERDTRDMTREGRHTSKQQHANEAKERLC